MGPLDINALMTELLAKARESSAQRAVQKIVGGPGTAMNQMLVALAGNARLDEHENPGEAAIQVLHGEVELGAGEDAWTVTAGQVLTVPSRRHYLAANGDAVVILTAVKRDAQLDR